MWQIISTIIAGIGFVGTLVCYVGFRRKCKRAEGGEAAFGDILKWLILACFAICVFIGFGIAALVAWL